MALAIYERTEKIEMTIRPSNIRLDANCWSESSQLQKQSTMPDSREMFLIYYQ